jgi:hypothetical protein
MDPFPELLKFLTGFPFIYKIIVPNNMALIIVDIEGIYSPIIS